MSIRSKALEALKTKFEGVDEKVLSRIVNKISKTVKSEDEVEGIVEDMTIQSIIDSYTDSRVNEGSVSAIESYERKHNIKDGKPVKTSKKDSEEEEGEEGNKSTGKNHDEMPEWAKALCDEIKSLKAEKTTGTRKSKIDELLKDADEATKKRTMREFGRIEFKDDADFDGWFDEVSEDIKANQATQKTPRTTAPKTGGGGGDDNKVNPLVQARTEAYTKAAETQTPAIQGL